VGCLNGLSYNVIADKFKIVEWITILRSINYTSQRQTCKEVDKRVFQVLMMILVREARKNIMDELGLDVSSKTM